MKKEFRPAAVPLITCDPYFSLWSFADRLTDDKTRHWTGAEQSLSGVLTVDGEKSVFLGRPETDGKATLPERILEQISLTVNPITTVYSFSHPVCDFKVTFFTPLFLDRPEILSRPVSYVFYEITPKEEGHDFEVYFGASCQLAGDLNGQTYEIREEPGHAVLGNREQKVLNRCGDDVRIDWGYLHLVHENAKADDRRQRYAVPDVLPTAETAPILCAVSKKLCDHFVLAYDDIHSVLVNGKPEDCYYRSVYGDFSAMLKVAVRDAEALFEEAKVYDAKLISDMEKISPLYAKIGALAYRQAIAAHKLVTVDGKIWFLSKECFSNGCLGTLDVTYPSIPLFLLYNPELVRGMLRPLFAYARSETWKDQPFAPHDCGRYPFCNGQVYGVKDGVINQDKQMPVEECGNAILTAAAICAADGGDRSFASENKDLLTKWADYLAEYGYNPGNQLCTDDFAGHLAHNCNLSLKAIVALGAYADLFDAPAYMEIAKDMAKRWTAEAKVSGGKGFRLTFDRNDTWSLKYNIVWDKLLHLNLFDPSVFTEEVEVYKQKMNVYGVPLDCRADYTKLDWLEWTTVMTDDREYLDAVNGAIAAMISETVDRVPMTDWYETLSGQKRCFQARSVVGGFFINQLADLLK